MVSSGSLIVDKKVCIKVLESVAVEAVTKRLLRLLEICRRIGRYYGSRFIGQIKTTRLAARRRCTAVRPKPLLRAAAIPLRTTAVTLR